MYAYVCSKTARSVNLETYCKLLIGGKFEKSANKPGYLRSGRTSASFQTSGKCPLVIKQLIMCVIRGRSTSKQETTSEVSNSQTVLGLCPAFTRVGLFFDTF